MIRAVAVIGPPLSGVTALLSPYEDRIVRYENEKCGPSFFVGGLDSCQQSHSKSRKPRIASLRDASDAQDSSQGMWVVLDGFPYTPRQLYFLGECVELRGIVEVHMEPLLWERRIQEIARQHEACPCSFSREAAIRRAEYERGLKHLRPACYKRPCPLVRVSNVPGSPSTQQQLEIAITSLCR